VVGGCADGLRPAAVELELSGVKPTADVSDLAAVLAGAVTKDGRVAPAAISRLSGRLDTQLRKMAVAGPTATPGLYPTYGCRWAYWYNARAGWSLKLSALAGCPRKLCPRAMCRRRFPLDGRSMSLSDIDAILLAEAERTGDFRLAACAPGVQVSYGPMPQRPYAAADFGERVSAMLSRLVLDERRFVVDVAARTVRVPPMLWAGRQSLFRQYRRDYGTQEVALATALRAYVDRRARRRLEECLGYKAVPRKPSGELAIPRARIYYPGKIGRIEP